MSETINQARQLQQLKSTEVVRNDYVRQQFIDVYNMIWKEGGEAAYERESINFNRQLRDNEKLRKCTGLSVFFAFIDLAVQRLTLETGSQALCYLLPRSYKVGIDGNGNDMYELRCNLTISGYGELVLRARAGQILHADNPVIVYEGDEFSYGEADGRKFVNYRCCFPRKSERVVACFIKITRVDGTADYSVMLENDWRRLSEYSEKNNSYYDKKTQQRVGRANALYSSNNGQIDVGFLIAKCIKHAFKTYPRVEIGRGTQLESSVIDGIGTNIDPYGGIKNEEDEQNVQGENQQDDSFAKPIDTSAGVVIDTSDSDDDTF